jgi:endonuclease/exonuclease/phosphatase family metal-dependent hydrolase
MLFAFLECVATAGAEEVRIVTWNVRNVTTVENAKVRSEQFREAATEVRPDILVLQEVNSLAVVKEIGKVMGLEGYHAACSNFSPGDPPDFTGLEVGILSKYPLSRVIEYDPTPDNTTSEGEPEEHKMPDTVKVNGISLGIDKPKDEFRGYLWARIDAIQLTIAVVHLKSSRGEGGPMDKENAEKREYVAAMVAVGVLEDMRLWPDYTYVVAGDFNVGHSDETKNGTDLKHDCYAECEGKDLYDETHAIFGGGLVGGLKMHNQVGHTRMPTFPSFPSTPIDNIYVSGKGRDHFSRAWIEKRTFGSDHRPVRTNWER